MKEISTLTKKRQQSSCRFFPLTRTFEQRKEDGRGHRLSCQFGFNNEGKKRGRERGDREKGGKWRKGGVLRIKRKLLMSLAPRRSFYPTSNSAFHTQHTEETN